MGIDIIDFENIPFKYENASRKLFARKNTQEVIIIRSVISVSSTTMIVFLLLIPILLNNFFLGFFCK
jgi:hypothetical protein